MMDREKFVHGVLEEVARSNIPDDARIQMAEAQAAKAGARRAQRALRLSRRGVIVALAILLLVASLAFAAYELLADAGLQGVREAGLGTNLNLTALPSVHPEITPIGGNPRPATVVGAVKTMNGVTVSLDWVSVNSSHLVLGFSAAGLEGGMSFDIPAVMFVATPAEQYRGASLSLTGDRSITGEYISYQVIDEAVLGGKTNLGIDLPLTELQGGEPRPAATFHFDLEGIPTDSGQPGVRQQTYSSKVNGLELRLEWVKTTPTDTTAKFCFASPVAGQEWNLRDVSEQLGGAEGQLTGKAIGSDCEKLVSDTGGERCLETHVPLGGNVEDREIKLSVGEVSAGSDVRKGPWDFYIGLPDRLTQGGLAMTLPTPEGAPTETVGPLTATLGWAYADANRVAMEIHFSGWKEGYGLGAISAKDSKGVEINASYGSTAEEGDPSTQIMVLQPEDPAIFRTSPVALHLDLPVFSRDDPSKPRAVFHFDLSLPVYQAKTYDLNQTTGGNGLEMRLLKADVTPSYTEVTLCYRKPALGPSSDWMLGRSSQLQIGESQAGLESYVLLYDSDYGGYAGKGAVPQGLPTIDSGRCVKAGFPVGDLARPGPLKMLLTIPELEKSMPEVIPDDELSSALQKLKAQGIDITVFSSQGSGGGGGGYTINAKPAGMTDEEAYHRFQEALGYFYPGPWVFTLQTP